jgi:hypothetical protein
MLFREEISRELVEWEVAVHSLRKHYYFLNFFTIRQLLAMRALAEGGVLTQQLFDWLRFVKLDLDKDHVEAMLAKYRGKPPPKCVIGHNHTKIFEEIGFSLAAIFSSSSECNRTVPDVNRETGDFKSGEPNLVIAANEEAVLATSLSIYVKLGQRVPEAEEVLVCSETTTEEMIRLFLMRCLGAIRQGRVSRIYCIASVELLSFELQVSINRILGELLDSKTGVYSDSDKYKLIIISGKEEKQQVVTDFGNFTRLRLRPLHQDAIQAVLIKFFELEHIRVEVFHSRYAGQGKTKYINEWCEREGYQPPQVVPILSPLSSEEFVGILLNASESVIDKAALQSKRAYHLDMSPTVTSSMSALLFQLLVTGCLMRANGEIYHRPPNMAYLLEIPNSINDEAHKRLYFADLLPLTLVDNVNNPLAVTSHAPFVYKHYRVTGMLLYACE